MRQATQLLNFGGTKKQCNLDVAERPEEIPNTAELKAFMHKHRKAEELVTCIDIVNFLKRSLKERFDKYLATRNCGYQSLLELLHWFARTITSRDNGQRKENRANWTSWSLEGT
ncbi:hypothetical protein H310_12455 [Aphanomyces invadans]|uniref:Uncharacterized protein n=1 Tax=Aphanomyces invadans TaxID=157072 RepID=A0A024TI61_9STRA|nr:hypothetical protein H310_12455 [Aphanomyces invadans]ETV93689.1 hypothetical protein H310_12455 [Aphanomyces invadans]|eukprot:XP_008877730.1 hypothetical protein H310_12455 [Aphanomyces invadans]